MRNDPGLAYERIRWRIRDNDRDGVRELLLATPNEVPYPEKWWPIRDRQVREAIGEGNIKLAERLLAHHGQKTGTIPYKEAQWLKAWIDLEYRNLPEKSHKEFTKLLEEMETPSGKARAAYWAGRAAEKISKGNPARWFGEASSFSTTFYGQLAAWELSKDDKNRHGHVIKSTSLPTAEEKARFRKHELVQLVYELANAKEDEQVGKFIYHILQNAKTGSEGILATELGQDIHRIDLSVRASKKALQQGMISLEYGWPVISFPEHVEVENALLMALVRQESEFYAGAVSPSGAIGLTQLLPATAKETARRSGLSYSNESLYNPGYNMMLGSIYLNKLINKFEGSYLLATASYNAGAARVQQWVNEFGRPGRNVRENIDWIERIPTSETRNYVQHVLENVEVYRFLLNGHKVANTMISDDLIR